MAGSNEDADIFSDFIEEKIGTQIIDIQAFKMMKKVFKIARMAVCKVKPATHDDQGTGAFYEVIDPNGSSNFSFITCNHVLPTNSLNEVSQAVLEFEEIEKMKSIKLETKQIKYIWTSKIFDTTIIEIAEELANKFKSYGVKFLPVGQVAANMEFVLLQYPKGKFGIAHGEVDHINGHDVYSKIGTAPGSSGSPLLDMNCVAIAMHRAGAKGSAGEKPEVWRHAIALKDIIEAFLQEKSNDSHLQ